MSNSRPSLAEAARRALPWLAPLALFAASLGAALVAGLRATGGRLVYALDDAYIHMAVARNVAEAGVWGCTPFHFSSSSSSLLWTSALALAYAVTGVHEVTPLLLNVAAAVATLVGGERWLARFGVPPLLRAVALVGVLVALPLAGMALMGMEHVLHLLLTLAFAAAAVEALAGPPPAGRRTAALCALAALLATSRYEGLFLVGLVCLAFLARGQVLRALAIGAAALVPVAAFGAYSMAHGGFFLPNSLMLKAAGESASAWSALLKPPGAADLEFLRTNRALPILCAGGLVGALVHWRAAGSFWRPAVLLPLLLAMLILVHGHYVFSPTFWRYRYDAYLVGLGVFVAAVVLAGWRGPARAPAGVLPAVAVALLVVLVSDVREGVFPADEVDGMRNTFLEHEQAAEFVRLYYGDAVVAVNDLGAVAYGTHAHLLDLVGLGDVEPLRIMQRTGGYARQDVTAWTAPYRPSVAIVQLDWGWIVPRIPREWIEVAQVEVPTHHQRIGFFAVDPGQAFILRASVQQHYEPLVPALGYRVKLRAAERVGGQAAAAGAGER